MWIKTKLSIYGVLVFLCPDFCHCDLMTHDQPFKLIDLPVLRFSNELITGLKVFKLIDWKFLRFCYSSSVSVHWYLPALILPVDFSWCTCWSGPNHQMSTINTNRNSPHWWCTVAHEKPPYLKSTVIPLPISTTIIPVWT